MFGIFLDQFAKKLILFHILVIENGEQLSLNFVSGSLLSHGDLNLTIEQGEREYYENFFFFTVCWALSKKKELTLRFDRSSCNIFYCF